VTHDILDPLAHTGPVATPGDAPDRRTIVGVLAGAGTAAVLAIFGLSFWIMTSPPPSAPAATVPDGVAPAIAAETPAPAGPGAEACPLPASAIAQIAEAEVRAEARDEGCRYTWERPDGGSAGRLTISAYPYAADVTRVLTLADGEHPYGGGSVEEVLTTAEQVSGAGNASLGRWERVVSEPSRGLVSDGWSTAVVASDDTWYDIVLTHSELRTGFLPFVRDLADALIGSGPAGSSAGLTR
jgi:hypothetical protein